MSWAALHLKRHWADESAAEHYVFTRGMGSLWRLEFAEGVHIRGASGEDVDLAVAKHFLEWRQAPAQLPAVVESAIRVCADCGAELKAKKRFCTQCGAVRS